MDYTYSYGKWGTDNVKIDGVKVENLYFAVANESGSDVGVLGIGPKFIQSADEEYANLPFALKKQGLIKKVAYSVYLNEPDADHGTVLFGAIDLSKYTGTLMTLPVIENDYYDYPVGLQVLLSGLYFSDGKGDIDVMCNYTMPALLDTGTTLSYLPPELVENIAFKLNAVYSSSMGAYRVSCTMNENYEFIFDFNGKQIHAPVSTFIFESTNGNCYLGILEDSYYITLGDNVVRNMYMVVDLEDNEISLAQASFSDSDDDIKIISDSVPNATKAPNYSYTEAFEYITLTPSITASSFSQQSSTTVSEVESVLASDDDMPSGAVSSISSIGTRTNYTRPATGSTKSLTSSRSTTMHKTTSNDGEGNQVTSKETEGSQATSGSSLTSARGASSTSQTSSELAAMIQPSKFISTFLTLLAAIFVL